jgi:hypothetical protein
MTPTEIHRSVGPTRVDRDLFERAVRGWCLETFGCQCTACVREWLRLKVLTPNGWASRVEPDPQDPCWHLRDLRADDFGERVRRAFGGPGEFVTLAELHRAAQREDPQPQGHQYGDGDQSVDSA